MHPSQIDALADSTIEVPFPPESEASGIGDRGFHSVLLVPARVRAASPAASA